MANQDPQLRRLVDQFISELTVIVHQQALDTVREALGGSPAPKRRGPGRPAKSTAARKPARKSSKRGRRSAEDVAALGNTVLTHIQANPGQRLEEIGRELETATKDLKRPIANLMEAGRLRTEGQKRGTKYFAGRGKAKAAKKTGRKATSKRKTAKRKTTKRKTTKKRGR